MPAQLFRWQGVALKRFGRAARSQNCCCDQNPSEFAMAAASTLRVSVGGAVSGIGLISQSGLGAEVGLSFMGAIELDKDNDREGELDRLFLKIQCPEKCVSPTDITCALRRGGESALREGVALKRAPDSIDLGPPLTAVWRFEGIKLPPRFTAGDNEGIITVVVAESLGGPLAARFKRARTSIQFLRQQRRAQRRRLSQATTQQATHVPQVSSHSQAKAVGAGTHLKRILNGYGLRENGGCRCRDLAGKMDRQGIEWCEANSDLIADQMVREAQRREWPLVAIASYLGFSGLADGILHSTAKKLIETAIARARSAESQ